MPVKSGRSFPVSLQDIPVGIYPAVSEERPAPAHILSPVKVYVNDLHAFLLFAELCKDLSLRACGFHASHCTFCSSTGSVPTPPMAVG